MYDYIRERLNRLLSKSSAEQLLGLERLYYDCGKLGIPRGMAQEVVKQILAQNMRNVFGDLKKLCDKYRKRM